MKNEDVSLLISNFESADLFLRDFFFLYFEVGWCFEYCDSLILLVSLGLFFLWLLFYVLSLAIQSFLDLSSNADYLAIFDNIFRKFLQKLLFGRWFQIFILIGLEGAYTFSGTLVFISFCQFVNHFQKNSIRMLSFEDIGEITIDKISENL